MSEDKRFKNCFSKLPNNCFLLGPTGPTGPTGADGKSISIKGSVGAVSNLPAAGVDKGDAEAFLGELLSEEVRLALGEQAVAV